MVTIPDIPFPEVFPSPRKGRVAALGDAADESLFLADVDDPPSPDEVDVKPPGNPDARQTAKNKPQGNNDASNYRK
jgi:hypothetical protein